MKKLNISKYTVIICQIIIFALLMYFAALNAGNTAIFKYAANTRSLAGNTALVILASYFFGLLSGIVHTLINKNFYRSQIDFYSRKNEKLSQQREIETDTRQVLERKIAALETALNNVLKDKDKK